MVRTVLAAAACVVVATFGATGGNFVYFALGALVAWLAQRRRSRAFGSDIAEVAGSMVGVAIEPFARTVRRGCADQLVLLIVAVPLTFLGALDVVVVFGGMELGLAIRSARVVALTRAEQRRRDATRFRIDEDTRIYSRKKNSRYAWVPGQIGYRETHIRSAAL